MSYFLTSHKLNTGENAELTGEEAGHVLLSRRMKKGEEFNLQDREENRYKVEITEAHKNTLKVKVKEKINVPEEPRLCITLFQSYVNEKALDFILQKSTELGAVKIVLFNSQNTAVKLKKEVFEKKKERWQKILWEAAKQSDRIRPPSLEFMKDIDTVKPNLSLNYDKNLLCDASGHALGSLAQSFKQFKSCSIIIGPEGGFTNEEVSGLKSVSNLSLVSLGPVLLRAETAAIASLAIVRNLS